MTSQPRSTSTRNVHAIRQGENRHRAGFSAVEVLVAMLIGAALLQGLWSLTAIQRRVSAEIHSHAEGLEAESIVRVVLRAETRAGVAFRDWLVPSSGVVRLRAFRGWGTICTGSDLGALIVGYRGMRAPDPSKDSVLVLDHDGLWHAVALVSRTVTTEFCSGPLPTTTEVWRIAPEVGGGVVVRLFESGSYHLTDASLRYRRGLGGRQPLTTAMIEPENSGIEAVPGGGRLSVRIFRQPTSGWSRGLWGNRLPKDGSR